MLDGNVIEKNIGKLPSNLCMKAIPVILSLCLIYKVDCSTQPSKKNNPPSNIITPDTINFKTQIQPIFVRNCSPCHFPGGKMHEKLPFDTAVTILNNSTAILRRIKDVNEKKLVSDFVTEAAKN